MRKEIKQFIIKGLWVTIILFIFLYLILQPLTLCDVLGVSSEAITCASIILFFYERVLWKFNPFEKVPKLYGDYKGYIEYSYEESQSKKEIIVKIQQSLLTSYVKIVTDEMSSYTIASDIVRENNEHVLYYTYRTHPKSKYIEKNPIQFGTCRLIQKNANELEGSYWTNRKTIGDVYLTKKDK